MKFNKKIYYHDTDSGGVVYYANYLKYFEEARTEYLQEKAVILKELVKEGINFAVRDTSVTYKAPARYGDLLIISSKIEKIKSASLIFHQEAHREDTLLVTAQTTLVCIDTVFSPIAIPQKILTRIRPS